MDSTASAKNVCAISAVFVPVDMHWNHSHPCKVDCPKKWFQKVFFGAHSRHWLRWIFLIPCLRLSLLCAVLALLFAFLHCLTGVCWKTIKESGCSWSILWSWFALLHVWKSAFSWSGTGWLLWLRCCHSRDLWRALVQPPAWRGPVTATPWGQAQLYPACSSQTAIHEYSASEQPVPVLFIHILQERGSGVHYTTHFQNEKVAQTNTQDFWEKLRKFRNFRKQSTSLGLNFLP